jgi:hypothetical protein
MPGRGAAGVLLLVHRDVIPIFHKLLVALNARGRVSEEVLSLHLVQPTLEAVLQLNRDLCRHPQMQNVENLPKMRPNNGLRDLLARNRLPPWIVDEYMLVVGVETVTEAFRAKYPNPNLTLQAGSVERGETVLQAAIRELYEESRVLVHWQALRKRPIRLLGGGLTMFPCIIDSHTLVRLTQNAVYIGRWDGQYGAH